MEVREGWVDLRRCAARFCWLKDEEGQPGKCLKDQRQGSQLSVTSAGWNGSAEIVACPQAVWFSSRHEGVEVVALSDDANDEIFWLIIMCKRVVGWR